MCSNDYSRQLGELDAVVSECRAFGNIEDVEITASLEITASKDVLKKLRNIIAQGSGTADLIWGPELEIIDIKEGKNE